MVVDHPADEPCEGPRMAARRRLAPRSAELVQSGGGRILTGGEGVVTVATRLLRRALSCARSELVRLGSLTTE